MTEVQKKLLTILAVSLDGYVRMFKTKESKNLEICAQINLQDKVFKAIPLQLNV